jgi:hypothetical protein
MMQTVAIAAIAIALMAGYYFARWQLRENSVRSATAQLEGAIKQAWRARKAILFTALATAALIEYWIRSHGR